MFDVKNQHCRNHCAELTVAFNHERLNHIMPDQLKIRMAHPMANVCSRPGEEVVEDGDFMPEQHQSIHQMRTDEASATGDQDPLSLVGGK